MSLRKSHPTIPKDVFLKKERNTQEYILCARVYTYLATILQVIAVELHFIEEQDGHVSRAQQVVVHAAADGGCGG